MKNQTSKLDQFISNELFEDKQKQIKGGGFVTLPLGKGG